MAAICLDFARPGHRMPQSLKYADRLLPGRKVLPSRALLFRGRTAIRHAERALRSPTVFSMSVKIHWFVRETVVVLIGFADRGTWVRG